jgi:hypothetical protein
MRLQRGELSYTLAAMRFLLFFPALMASEPPGFEPVGEQGGCAFSATAPGEDGFPLLRAECRWPEIPAEALEALLGDWGGHQEIWSTVVSSRVVSEQGDGTLVVHVHQAPAMADREVLLRMWVEEVPGGRAYRWSRAEPQPAPSEGRVTVERDDGCYTVLAEGEGSHLIATLRYDPGGFIPAALVRWFQVLGMPGMLEELRGVARPGSEGGAP